MSTEFPPCDDAVYAHGTSLGFFDMTANQAEAHYIAETARTGSKHDWHYVAGRVHIKVLLPAQSTAVDTQEDLKFPELPSE